MILASAIERLDEVNILLILIPAMLLGAFMGIRSLGKKRKMRCKYCRELIAASARVCPYCRRTVTNTTATPLGQCILGVFLGIIIMYLVIFLFLEIQIALGF